ncbi:protein Atossa isoform X2 [Drosophila montana]|uniref:protein Atossa isoform X2 n=1 Tax=Drosophila montana TaxID=40370 RepID=UPI00313B7A1A
MMQRSDLPESMPHFRTHQLHASMWRLSADPHSNQTQMDAFSILKKVPPPTMTLPSLCSAIRSQLYFSQIVAWCDLLRKCDPSVYDSGRVIFANGGSSSSTAGDLAGHSASTSSAAAGARRPRLNIFYRIRPHDLSSANGNHNDGGFSAKANVHNFPHVNIAENFSVAVCVKSLPRFNGGLPHVSPAVSKPRAQRAEPAASTPTGGGGMCAATPTGLGARIAISTTPPASSCDKFGARHQQEREAEAAAAAAAAEEDGARDDLDGHRERQLQKYRKRMQRRDKKRERKPSDQLEHMEPMDEGSEETQAQAMVLTLTAPRRIAMISTGTQTSLSSCQQCGSEKTLLCLNCSADDAEPRNGNDDNDDDGDDTSASEMEDSSSCSLSSSDLIVGTPRNKAELLLQAIQRTPKNRKPTPKAAAAAAAGAAAGAASNDLKAGLVQGQSRSQNNNQLKPAPTSGCQVCKRQKTQHNFGAGKASPKKAELLANGTNGTNGHSNGDNEGEGADNSMDQEVEVSASTKLTPNIDRCSLNAGQERCQTPTDVAGCAMDERIVVQFKTPISHVPLKLQEFQAQSLAQHQQQLPLTGQPTKAPNQLRLNCTGGLLDRETPPPMLSPLLRKALPKVNLTTIFCSSSAPITIDSGLAFCFEPPALSYAHSQSQSQSLLTPPEAANLPVQKSYSAPTLPNALSVSPRFAKQAAFYKRRSRHLSDRSDRSSLGSDEQLSDEDLESGMCSPAGSPLKTRARLATQFGGRPLLGNLEESLLQKRLLPKIEVAGFRLQLGASGGFCPTQLTIPASSYFYELHGETLSTPYLCEIRLPRKGYFVPRSGTVQATLLNPMGTVVRMFVIPYDMRDMPPLHRTFIRQRILAEELPGASPCGGIIIMQPKQQQQQQHREREPGSPTATSTTSKLGHFISAEQMKRLRYSIHLRFQTSRSGRLSLHTDIRLLISRRTDCDTAAAHAKGMVEAPNELVTDTLMPTEPRYSARQESPGKI